MEEVVLWIFIALKNSSSSAGFEPANLKFNGKHDNHQTTENDSASITEDVFLCQRANISQYKMEQV
jgi:hypothetical protein